MEIQEKKWQMEREKLIDARRKNRELFVCALNWIRILENGTDLSVYFRKHECKKIGIYGAGELAELLIRELKKYDEFTISYLIDQTADTNRKKYGFSMYLPSEFSSLEDVDMIVVTAIIYFDSISENLIRMRPEISVVSLESVIKNRICEEYYE